MKWTKVGWQGALWKLYSEHVLVMHIGTCSRSVSLSITAAYGRHHHEWVSPKRYTPIPTRVPTCCRAGLFITFVAQTAPLCCPYEAGHRRAPHGRRCNGFCDWSKQCAPHGRRTRGGITSPLIGRQSATCKVVADWPPTTWLIAARLYRETTYFRKTNIINIKLCDVCWSAVTSENNL